VSRSGTVAIGDDHLKAVAEHVRKWRFVEGHGKNAAEPASDWTTE